jgi:hypothetical protein
MKNKLERADAIINQIQMAVIKWDDFANETSVTKDLKEAI